jgi:putative acetyltransferase
MSVTEYHILKATKDRMPEVARIFKVSFRHTYPNFPELHTPEEDRKYFTKVVFEKNDIFIAEVSGTAIGFIAFNNEFIDHLYLLPEAQRQGIGKKLLAIAKQHSDHLQLWTFQQNNPARSFYIKHGFVAVRETDGASNEEKQPDILFEWRRTA